MAKRGNNEGSITKRSNGKWRAQVSIDGKRLSFNGKTRAECQVWLRKMLDQIDQGLTYNGSQTTLAEFLSGWIATVKTSLRPKTAHQYEVLINNYIVPELGKIKLKDLRAENVDAFYQARLKAKTGARTVRYNHSVLHVGLEKAVKMGLIGHNPMDGATPPRLISTEMKVFDETQVSQFLVAVQDNRNKALYHLAVKTGMRQAELLGLKWQDLDWTSGVLQVKRQVQRVDGPSRILGHSKLSITLDIYGHLIPGMQSEAAKIMDDALTPIKVATTRSSKSVDQIITEDDGEKVL